jgi:hypothetical protein
MRVPAASADRKFAVFGAVEYATGEVCSQLSLRKSSDALVGFLEQLRHAWPYEKLVVVLDNVGYNESHYTRAWWRGWRPRICPSCLPSYTPELNLMGRVRHHVKDKLSCHH